MGRELVDMLDMHRGFAFLAQRHGRVRFQGLRTEIAKYVLDTGVYARYTCIVFPLWTMEIFMIIDGNFFGRLAKYVGLGLGINYYSVSYLFIIVIHA